MKNQLIYSVSELFSDDFMNSQKDWKFVIPDYQRGYKWGETPIRKLLDDINNFNHSGDCEKFYCLNNLTLVKSEAGFNVVDGQQRLTTITVILSCLKNMGKENLPQFENKMSYQIREKSGNFINNYLIGNQNVSCNNEANVLFHQFISDNDWNKFIECEGDEYDYQDIYYLFKACKVFESWFREKNENEQRLFVHKFLNNVKLIINLVPDVNSEEELFGNLNSHKVPLDGADLIRALIITNVARYETQDLDDSTKKVIQINERRIRIGLQIDAMMHWWKNEEHQKFYEPIISQINKIDSTSNITFDDKRHPINCLYKLYTLLYKGEKQDMKLSIFEDDIVEKWQEMVYLQRVLEHWYNDDKIYHALGFVIRYSSKKDLRSYIYDWYQNQWMKEDSDAKSFYKFLLGKIKEIIVNLSDDRLAIKGNDMNSSDQEEYRNKCFEENWYDGDEVIPVMVLLDIIASEKRGNRLSINLFDKNDEDKEHIFPQTPLGGVTNKKDLGSRLNILTKYVELVNSQVDGPEKCNEDIQAWPKDDDTIYRKIEDLQEDLNKKIKMVVPINSIGNICLLDKSVNRSYGNDYYTGKRQDIIFHFCKNSSIRPSVLEAFDKAWEKRDPNSSNIESIDNWNADDIINRRMYIEKSISEYLNQQ